MSPIHILTAAHCFDHVTLASIESSFTVVAGEHDIRHQMEMGESHHEIAKATIHPDYNKKTHDNDFAILRLKSPGIKLSPRNSKVGSIGFPPSNYEQNLVAGKTNLTVSGGETSNSQTVTKVPY